MIQYQRIGPDSDRVAIYCRLSEEDAGKDDPLAESESIQNQKSLLLSYALAQGWELCGVYCDEDYSGIDSNRPEWNRLLADARAGRFDIVLCKTQSRFTRDMEMVEKYLHHCFPEWGIRFVAVVDHVDTGVRGGKKARQINGLINEWYLEDLSENVRSVLDDKRRRGRFIGSYEPYGYRKSTSDHGTLVVDDEAAAVVRQIFSLRLEGFGCLAIARQLNDTGVLTPTDYKRKSGLPYKPVPGERHLWRDDTVREILTRRTYVGDMVQGKTRRPSYKSRLSLPVPSADWIVVEGTHPAIISREEFDRVQELLHSGAHPIRETGAAHPLAGKLRCLFCGSVMHRSRAKGISYLRCKAAYRYGSGCTTRSVRLDEVERAVLERLRQHCRELFDIHDFCDQIEGRPRVEEKLARCRARAAQCEGEITHGGDLLAALYADKVAGVVSPEEFSALRKRFAARREQLKQELARLELQMEELSGQKRPPTLAERAANWHSPQSLTRALADALIDCIELGISEEADEGQPAQILRIRIHWKF